MLKKIKLIILLLLADILGYTCEEKADLRLQKSSALFDTAHDELEATSDQLLSGQGDTADQIARKREEIARLKDKQDRLLSQQDRVSKRIRQIKQFTSF